MLLIYLFIYPFDTVFREAIKKATSPNVKYIGIVLSVLGRQGNPRILKHIIELLDKKKIKHIEVLLSDVSFENLLAFKEVDAYGNRFFPEMLTPSTNLPPVVGSNSLARDYPLTGLPRRQKKYQYYLLMKRR